MSIELTVKIWTDKQSTPQMQMSKLLRIVNDSVANVVGWKGLIVRNINLSKEQTTLEKPLTPEKIGEVLEKYDSDKYHFSVQSAMPCWRFEGINPVQGYLPFWVESWGTDFANSGGRDIEIEGNAALIFSSSGPFTVLIENELDKKVQIVNQCVEENLKCLMGIIIEIIKKIQPLGIKVFTARGLYQPMNAHLAYFRDMTVLKNDLILIKRIWDSGLPGYRTPSLKNSLQQIDRYALSPLRAIEEAKRLVLIIKDLITNVDNAVFDRLEEINWESVDNLEMPEGRIVFEYPHWVNSFIDHFYLEALKTLKVSSAKKNGEA